MHSLIMHSYNAHIEREYHLVTGITECGLYCLPISSLSPECVSNQFIWRSCIYWMCVCVCEHACVCVWAGLCLLNLCKWSILSLSVCLCVCVCWTGILPSLLAQQCCTSRWTFFFATTMCHEVNKLSASNLNKPSFSLCRVKMPPLHKEGIVTAASSC